MDFMEGTNEMVWSPDRPVIVIPSPIIPSPIQYEHPVLLDRAGTCRKFREVADQTTVYGREPIRKWTKEWDEEWCRQRDQREYNQYGIYGNDSHLALVPRYIRRVGVFFWCTAYTVFLIAAAFASVPIEYTGAGVKRRLVSIKRQQILIGPPTTARKRKYRNIYLTPRQQYEKRHARSIKARDMPGRFPATPLSAYAAKHSEPLPELTPRAPSPPLQDMPGSFPASPTPLEIDPITPSAASIQTPVQQVWRSPDSLSERNKLIQAALVDYHYPTPPSGEPGYCSYLDSQKPSPVPSSLSERDRLIQVTPADHHRPTPPLGEPSHRSHLDSTNPSPVPSSPSERDRVIQRLLLDYHYPTPPSGEPVPSPCPATPTPIRHITPIPHMIQPERPARPFDFLLKPKSAAVIARNTRSKLASRLGSSRFHVTVETAPKPPPQGNEGLVNALSGRRGSNGKHSPVPKNVNLPGLFDDLEINPRWIASNKQKAAEKEAKARAAREKKEAEERAIREREEAELRAQLAREREEELAKQGRRRLTKDPCIQPLTTEQNEKLDKAMAKGQKVTALNGTELTSRDWKTILEPEAWLNDNIIVAYLEYTVKMAHERAKLRRNAPPIMHAFNNNFFNNLRSQGHAGVARWTRRPKIQGKALLPLEYVFVPVNASGNHWTLAVISPVRRTIEYFDSLHMPGQAEKVTDLMKVWLEGELGEDYKAEEWTIRQTQGPHQGNFSDCGVHTVTTAKLIALGIDPMAAPAEVMATQRRRIVAELLNSGFHGEYEVNFEFA